MREHFYKHSKVEICLWDSYGLSIGSFQADYPDVYGLYADRYKSRGGVDPIPFDDLSWLSSVGRRLTMKDLTGLFGVPELTALRAESIQAHLVRGDGPTKKDRLKALFKNAPGNHD